MLKLKKELYDELENWETEKHEIIKDDEVVGVAYTIVNTEDTDEVYLEDISIEENYRNQGIGSWTIKQLAEEYGFIYFSPTNENNKRLYERIAEEYTVNTPEVDQGFGVYYLEK